MRLPHGIILVAILALSACTERQGDLNLRNLGTPEAGPDEFSVLPGKPLEMPEQLASLPEPTPGGANLTDQNPLADGVAALGGRPGALVAQGPSGADSALVQHVARNGVNGDIRMTLAAEDEEFRRRRSRLTQFRLFRDVDRYHEVYSGEMTDPAAELRRFRRLGVATPSAPPF
ncbi:MAG: DUF3035 domain-containing protein [Paracoccaceae bacterium]